MSKFVANFLMKAQDEKLDQEQLDHGVHTHGQHHDADSSDGGTHPEFTLPDMQHLESFAPLLQRQQLATVSDCTCARKVKPNLVFSWGANITTCTRNTLYRLATFGMLASNLM